MAKYIEKSTMKQYIKNFCQGLIADNRRFDPVDDCALLCDVVNFAPAADVVEVKHGYWEKSTDNGTEMHQCSVCGARVVKGVYEYENPNKYCYHCGAKMEQILRIVDDGVKDVTTPELIKRYNHYFDNGYIDDDTEE